MADNVRAAARAGGDSEKITINLGHVDLGRVDLLVQEGFYSNRTDFIRTAIRNQLACHAPRSPARSSDTPSSSACATIRAAELEGRGPRRDAAPARVGLARIAPDVTPDLAPPPSPR